LTDFLDRKSCAVVVTYNPDITALLKLLGQLNKETDFIVIDNESAGLDDLCESIVVYERCKDLIRLTENEGLAKAINIGINQAIENDYDYVFLFDQDSSLCDLFIDRMIKAYEKAEKLGPNKIAALGPRIINPQSMRQTPFKLFNRFMFRSDRYFVGSKSHFVADFLITSGSLLEWCFRAKSKGFDLVGTDEAVLYHAIGERSVSSLVRAGIIAQHNPSRTYYSSRNRTHLYRAAYAPIGWVLRDIIRFTIKASWLFISSSERKQYWQNISSGIRDARSLS
jgi:rhamnosyltransferase